MKKLITKVKKKFENNKPLFFLNILLFISTIVVIFIYFYGRNGHFAQIDKLKTIDELSRLEKKLTGNLDERKEYFLNLQKDEIFFENEIRKYSYKKKGEKLIRIENEESQDSYSEQ